MNRTRVGVAVFVALVAAGCGEGRAIFNVDVYSFIKSSANDTVPYAAPPGPGYTVANTPQKINLFPGLASSAIDTVKVTGTADLENQSGGPGTLDFQVYLAADSASTYVAGARDSLFAPAVSGSVNGANTTTIALVTPNLSPSGDSLFTKSAVWVRIVATISNSGATILQGQAVLTSLELRVVVRDKVF